ncbi:metal-dependent hydrolase [Blattabacterium cuenoti]|uniref:metal-dependent hydrolase n=1 Tax=Blattabacterium cuenoti TaxID=1653831 RepID=UPI00163C71AA|nr:metal-dependent hydrolase [Blattabacterium cuenoti]
MELTYFTHSTCLLKIREYSLLIDPFFTENPFFQEKEKTLLREDFFSIKKLEYILITHAHYDHVCDVEFIARRFNSLIISNYEISSYYDKIGLQTYGINYGSFISFPFGYIKYVWASHSSVFKDGTYGGNPGGFLLHTEKGNIYISGDTSLTYEMKLIPTFGKIKISILPIGGIYTMDIEEAIIASSFLKCDKILGVHYNTFKPIQINKKLAIKRFSEKKKKLFLLEKGEKILF